MGFQVVLTDFIREYIADQMGGCRRKILRAIKRLRDEGEKVWKRPWVGFADHGISYLVISGRIAHRIFMFRLADNIYLLRGFKKKTEELPAGELEQAYRDREVVMADMDRVLRENDMM